MGCTRHLWHFRRRDVARLLSTFGFELVLTTPMWLDAYYIALFSEKYRGRPAWLVWPLAILKGTISNALALTTKRPTSSTLFIARKAQAHRAPLRSS